MGKCLKLCALILGSTLAFGCASSRNSTPPPEPADETRIEEGAPTEETSLRELEVKEKVAASDPVTGQQVVKKAHSAIGTPYVLGGSAPGGFDCSGLVKWAYNSVGVNLPRTAREQSTVGKKIRNVEDMRAGDIVAFRHPKRGYHTGIYVGDGKFIHSPRQRTRVRINSLSDPYFSATLLGARRVTGGATEQIVAQAESRLEEYVSQRNQNLSIIVGDKDAADEPVFDFPKRTITKKMARRLLRKEMRKARLTAEKRAMARKGTKGAKEAARNVKKSNGKDAKVTKNGKNNKNSVKTVAQNSAKGKKAARETAKNAKTAKNSARKEVRSNAGKKSGKAVSMLQQKKAKAQAKGRRS